MVTASPLHRTSHGVTASSAKAELTMLADLLGESVSVSVRKIEYLIYKLLSIKFYSIVTAMLYSKSCFLLE